MGNGSHDSNPQAPAATQTGGGDFVSRDKHIQGDAVYGDKVLGDKITIGQVTAGSQVIIQNIERALSGIEQTEQTERYERWRLAEATQRYIESLQSQIKGSQRVSDQGNPYKGLGEYNLDDAEIFFGRSAAIEALSERLERSALTVLHAESGAGKTSLLKAGIMSRLLARGHVPLHVRPRQTPAPDAIKSALLAQSEQTSNLVNAPLRDFLRWVTDLLGGRRLVVILDQFEEVLAEQGPDAGTAFAQQLATCLDDASLPVRWIIALRGEWLTRLGTFEPHVRQPLANEYLLCALSPQEATEAVIEPARLRHVLYEAQLPERIIDDLRQDEGIAPPHLQLLCSALFEELRGGSQITHAMYEHVGKVEGVLRNHLQRVLDRVVPERQGAARSLLQALVTSDRRRALRPRDELVALLAAQGVDAAAFTKLLGQMVDSHLLRIEKTGANKTVLAYELVHDYLIAQIEIDPDLLARKAAEEMLARAVQDYGQSRRTLVDPNRLDVIEAQSQHLALTEDKLDLLCRSALVHGRSLCAWHECTLSSGRVEALADRWIAELQDAQLADTALRLLVSLAHPATVSRLVVLIESSSARGTCHPLGDPTEVVRRALAALSQMELAEAEAYLRRLTPEGYCFVPAGPFEMGSDELLDEQPRRVVRLPAFWIAVSPVTVGEWQQFIATGAYAVQAYWLDVPTVAQRARSAPSAWKLQHAQPQQPVRYVTWYEAIAYAAWLAARSGLPASLPTEAEWEKAAGWDRVAGKARRYPWGNQADPALCNVQGSGPDKPLPVVRSPSTDSPYGMHGAAGYVLEWTRTVYRPYPYDPRDGREVLPSEGTRVLRGGAYNLPVEDARCARRRVLDPAVSLSNTGCRVCLRVADVFSLQGPEHQARRPAAG